MQDPLITLYTVLKGEWGLSGDLAEANIRFSTGWYDKDFAAPQVTVTEAFSHDNPFELGYGVIRVYGTYQIDCWVTVLRATGKGPGKAKQHKWDMREEVKRILKANLTGLTDLRYVILEQTGRSLDEPDRSPPVLRYSLQVSVLYDI